MPKKIKKNIKVHDVGNLFQLECQRNRVGFSDQRILDLDQSLLRTLRSATIKETRIRILRNPVAHIHFIGVHATFRWKHRLIPGISYQDIRSIKPDGFLNVVDNIDRILEANRNNPKWDKDTLPDSSETQEWMMEEEFITELAAEIFNKPMFLIAKQHQIPNLADLFFTNKKKIYLSYPITNIRDEHSELLEQIQGTILEDLEKDFVVFNPLAIKDMALTYKSLPESLPKSVNQLTPREKEIIKARTIERDYQFIDQSDAVVVFYLTEKVSAGVIGEIYYAHRNQKPVFMVYTGARSPFLEDATTYIGNDIPALMQRLKEFAKQ